MYYNLDPMGKGKEMCSNASEVYDPVTGKIKLMCGGFMSVLPCVPGSYYCNEPADRKPPQSDRQESGGQKS